MIGWLAGVMDIPAPMLALVALAIVVGAFVQGISGLGLGLIAAPVLIAVDPRIGPGPLLAMSIPLSAFMMRREFGAIDRQGLALSLTGRFAGSILAGFLIAWLSVSAYELMFGLFILTAVILSLLGLRIERTPRNLLSAGVTSGIMGTLTGAGSPTIALIYQRSDGSTVRATLSAFFLASAFFSLLVIIAAGKMEMRQWALCLAGLPLMLIGYVLSNLVVRQISNDKVRLFVLGLAGASSLMLIVRAGLGLMKE